MSTRKRQQNLSNQERMVRQQEPGQMRTWIIIESMTAKARNVSTVCAAGTFACLLPGMDGGLLYDYQIDKRNQD